MQHGEITAVDRVLEEFSQTIREAVSRLPIPKDIKACVENWLIASTAMAIAYGVCEEGCLTRQRLEKIRKTLQRRLERTYLASIAEACKDYMGAVLSIDPNVVLDAGCGVGKNIVSWLKQGYAICLEIDPCISEHAVKIFNKLYRGPVDVVVADAHAMPIRDNAINLLALTGVVHELINPRKALEEAVRVAGAGSAIIISDKFSLGILTAIYSFKRFVSKLLRRRNVEAPLSLKALQKIVRLLNLHITRFKVKVSKRWGIHADFTLVKN